MSNGVRLDSPKENLNNYRVTTTDKYRGGSKRKPENIGLSANEVVAKNNAKIREKKKKFHNEWF